MRARAERQARVQPHDALGLWRCLMPTRHDPELRRDLDRRELALRQAHPVLLRHSLDGLDVHVGRPVLGQDQRRGFGGLGFGGEERLDDRALPSSLGRRHAGLAEQGLLGVGVGVGILHGHREGVDLHQRIADDLDVRLAADEGKLKQVAHQRLWAAIQPSR